MSSWDSFFFCGEFLPLWKQYFGKGISCYKFCVSENKFSAKQFTRNHHNCLSMKGCLRFFYFHILYRQIWLNFRMMMTSWAIYHKFEKEKRKHCRENETLHMRSWILRSFTICWGASSYLPSVKFNTKDFKFPGCLLHIELWHNKGNEQMIDVQCNRKGPFWNE